MMYDLILKNAQILIPTNHELSQRSSLKSEKLDLGIANGMISKIGSIKTSSSDQVLDLQGLFILPGIIDSQVHFREPGLTHKEDIESGSKAALLGGVTSFFEMPNTQPSTTTTDSLLQKINLSTNRSFTNFAFYVGGSGDNTLELRALEKSPHCPGVKIFMGSSTGSLLVDADENLEKILLNTSKRVVFHCEDEFILKDRKTLFFPKSSNPADHPNWRNPESSLNATRRILTLARKLNRKVHILHVTTAQEMELLSKNKDIATVEVLPQHLTLHAPDCYEKWGTLTQQNPPIREKNHQDGLWKGIQNGTVDIVASDHAPHTLEEKSKAYPSSPSGMPGTQTLLPLMLNHVNQGKLSLTHMTALMTENVRDIFGLKNKGRIQVGMDADLTVIDLNKETVISNRWIASKSQWTVFDGMKIKGWPTHVFLKGKLAMSDNQIIGGPKGEGLNFL